MQHRENGPAKAHRHGPITCKRLVLHALLDYEQGEMKPADRAELEQHLAACPPCLKFLDSYRATGRALRSLKPREIPPSLAQTVLEFVRARCRKKP